MGSTLLTLLGLTVFEIVSSVDNAVINAGVLQTMSKRSRRWFLGWGMIIAVVLVRGVLPWLIIWAVSPSLGFVGSLQATYTFNVDAASHLEGVAPLLLAGAGSFLMALFLHWLFIEKKSNAFPHEHFLYRNRPWFLLVLLVFLVTIWLYAATSDLRIAFYATAGVVLFGITYLIKRTGETSEEKILKRHSKALEPRKLLYLEVIDAVFSIDAIFGALAFTFSTPLILIGNGVGALVMRQLTVKNIQLVKRYKYLKHGAMYAMGALSMIMLSEVLGAHYPDWFSPVVAISIVGISFLIPVGNRRPTS